MEQVNQFLKKLPQIDIDYNQQIALQRTDKDYQQLMNDMNKQILTGSLKPYYVKKKHYQWNQQLYSITNHKIDNVVDIFFEMMKFDEKEFDTFHRKILNKFDEKELKYLLDNGAQKQRILMKEFNLNFDGLVYQLKQSQKDIISYFVSNAMKTIQKAVKENIDTYIQVQNEERFAGWYTKAKIKSEMPSVKEFKAIWYHGINKYHNIDVCDPIPVNHIVAMICYTDNTDLCTIFRSTYRKNNKAESADAQKLRHSQFANMGKLLYEAFVFYASKNSEIEILYHGM
eukprot:134981_1